MSLTTFWLGRTAAALVVMCIVGLFVTEFATRNGSGFVFVRKYTEALERDLRLLRMKPSGRSVLLVQLSMGTAAVVGSALLGQPWLLVLLPVIAVFIRVWLRLLGARRLGRFETQIEPWLNAVASALRATPSLGEAIASTLPLVQAPMSQEVDVLIKEYELGTPLDRALDNMATRVDSQTLAGTVLALKVARTSGGNLPEMLAQAAAVLRELARLEGVVRTKTAEGKAQALVIGALPIPMILLVNFIDDRFFEPMLVTVKGHAVLGGALLLWMAAIVLARKILTVDI